MFKIHIILMWVSTWLFLIYLKIYLICKVYYLWILAKTMKRNTYQGHRAYPIIFLPHKIISYLSLLIDSQLQKEKKQEQKTKNHPNPDSCSQLLTIPCPPPPHAVRLPTAPSPDPQTRAGKWEARRAAPRPHAQSRPARLRSTALREWGSGSGHKKSRALTAAPGWGEWVTGTAEGTAHGSRTVPAFRGGWWRRKLSDDINKPEIVTELLQIF